MKVLIVAKTRMGGGACVGAITPDGTSVRLIARDAGTNNSFNMEYNVGEVWEVDCSPVDRETPHCEDVLVQRKERLGTRRDVVEIIKERMPPRVGGVDVLYDGLTQSTRAGALYIARRTGIPNYSTMFWQPDQPLELDDHAKRIRYRYPTHDGGRTLTFVGFQPPRQTIPAHTLVRVSLAHWWRPKEKDDEELRCHVQISGWFLPDGGEPSEDSKSRSTTRCPVAVEPQQVLRSVFGFETFRPWQEEIIQNILDRQDTLVVMPTGGGKSLCYQLPALVFEGVTIVVSPLIALMLDQVTQLRALDIPAVFLNSTLAYLEYSRTMREIKQGRVKLVYASPETVLLPETLLMLEQSNFACLAIDEAHCISEWGSDFRPKYLEIAAVRQRFPHVPCVALTATATPRVQVDIADKLRLQQGTTFVTGFDRPNLFLEVQPRTDALDQTLEFIAAHPGESGIIYCATRDQVDNLTRDLQKRDLSVLPYHAGLDNSTRRHNQQQFVRDDTKIMVATIAFGMGIDKPNVRFILHYNLPHDLDIYYQQIGRAGRDGLRANCLLLFSVSDITTIRRLIKRGAAQEIPARLARLGKLAGWAQTRTCRRLQLLRYFGETDLAESCTMCDNCVTQSSDSTQDTVAVGAGNAVDAHLSDITTYAQKFLSCVVRSGEIFGPAHIIKILRGSRAQDVLGRDHHLLPTYGIGTDLSRKQWNHLYRQFLQQDLVCLHPEFGGVRLTEKGKAVLKGATVRGNMDGVRRPRFGAVDGEYDVGLFEQLRHLRKELADTANVPPYVIFHDRALRDMATYYPQSKESLERIYGIGQHKLERYAGDLLRVITDHCKANQIDEKWERPSSEPVLAAPAPSARGVDIVRSILNGDTVHETAKAFGLKPGTILSHLERHHDSGQPLSPDLLYASSKLPAGQRQAVLDAFARLGDDRLRPVYETFEGNVGYDELRLLRLCLRLEYAKV